MNESFVFYRSFAEALAELPAEQYKEVMVAICTYGLDGFMPEVSEPTSRAMLSLIKPQIDANEKRREAGRRGAESRWQSDSKPMANDSKPMASECDAMPNANANVNVNANIKEKDSKESKKKSSAFRRPTVDDVRAYCIERHNSVDPQRFVDFYDSKGWKVGKDSMKDWKACVRTWEQRNRGEPPKNTGITRGTDYDALLAARMRGG